MDSTTAYEALERFLAGYWTTRSRDNERFLLIRWLDWCHAHDLDTTRSAVRTRQRSKPSSLS